MIDARNDPRLAWLFAEPDPAAVVASMKESARRAAEVAAHGPAGYGTVPTYLSPRAADPTEEKP